MKTIKNLPVYILFLMLAFCTSCRQNQTNSPKDNSKSETKAIDTSWGADIMVRNIKKGRNGSILIASNKGVFRYEGNSFTNITSKISLPGLWFPDVLEDRNGNLWLIPWDFSTRPSKPGVYRYNGQAGLPTGQEGLQHFTTKEGLADNTVNSIYEDKAGNIWFGTNGGVSRYDGKSFRNFTTKDGLPSDTIGSILEDKTGKLWIVAGELCFYDGKTFTVPSPFRIKDGIGFGISSIIEDSKGNILFGSFKVTRKERISPGGVIYYGVIGLWRYDPSAALRTGYSTITKVSERGTSAIIEDKKGNIWTAGKLELNGKVWALSRFDQKSLYDKKPAVTEIMLGGQVMWVFAKPGILEADDGSIWFGGFGSQNGVYRYDGKTITVF